MNQALNSRNWENLMVNVERLEKIIYKMFQYNEIDYYSIERLGNLVLVHINKNRALNKLNNLNRSVTIIGCDST